jgi:hypothetical protein
VINALTKPENRYLEIGIESGYTISNTHFVKKVGVDPDPKCENIARTEIVKCYSDDYFENVKIQNDNLNICDNESVDSDDYLENLPSKTEFDVIFIDGMHHCENVLRDFNNSIKILSKNGIIFMDDILPFNYNEQLKIPTKHYYENGILKYGEEWTGDVWKFVYHLLKHYTNKVKVSYFYNRHYRGVLCLKILKSFEVVVSYDELNSYDYFKNFNDYLKVLELTTKKLDV